VTVTADDEEATYARVTRRILPFLFLCYVVAFLDRVNVGFAKLQMLADLQLSDAVYGAGAGIFFVGYFLFEVPSNILLERVGARRWIARIMITWGVLSALMAFVSGKASFYLLRFALGAAEAGFFPGIILYLTYWYPAARRARIVALFMLAIAFAGVVGGPFSGWVLSAGLPGLRGWQWLFVAEAVPSILIGLWVPFYLSDGVADAAWLSEDEKALLTRNLAAGRREVRDLSVVQTLKNPWVLLFSLVYFCISAGLYGISFWLPQVIRNAGVSDTVNVGLLAAVPYGSAAVAMVLVGRSSDRSGERRWHFALSAVVGGLGLIGSALAGPHLALAVAALALATCGVLSSFPVSWTMPTAILGGTAAAAGIALVNSIGGLAGYVSPLVVGWISERTHRLDYGLYVVAGCMFAGAVLVIVLVPARSSSRR